MNTTNLKCWLPFDSSTTFDYCGNTWQEVNSPTVGNSNAICGNALQLTNGAYLQSGNKILIGGQDFTIDFWTYANSSQNGAYGYSGILSFGDNTSNANSGLYFSVYNSNKFVISFNGTGTTNEIGRATINVDPRGTLRHYELDYIHSQRQVLIFIDGTLEATINLSAEYARLERYIYIGRTAWGASQYFQGSIDEFRIFDGVALHTSNFTPPTDTDYINLAIQLNGYADLVFDADTSLTINNPDILFAHWVQPVLTDDNGTVGDSLSVSSGGDADSTAYKAFDGNAGTNVNKMNQGAYLQFVTAETIRINAITISSDGYLPAKGDFQISKDNGTTWQKVGEWNDTAGTSLSASVVFSSVPIGNFFRLVSGARATAHSGNADIAEVVIDADVACNANIDLFFDTSRNLKSKWRYENYGTADLLSISGTTITDLPVSQAVFKSAFYQNQRVKCFDIPATDEIWCKFDVYTRNNNYRWRAYNDTQNNFVDGICSSSSSILFWSSSNSSNSVFEQSDALSEGVRQTVLLHMISGTTNGIIEAWLDGAKIHTYTGNVNNGNNFEDFYLQSDNGNYTFFSNVIISNYQIGLTDSTSIDIDIFFDTSRKAATIFPFDSTFDTCLKNVIPFDTTFDTCLKDVINFDTTFDTYRKVERSVDILCDTLRNIPYKLIIDPVDNSGVPVVLPQTNGIQSIDINISAGQLIDQLSVVTVNNIDILSVIQGQLFDYFYNYRVEKFSRRGNLVNCQCCSNLDSLLYTQMAYKLRKETWNGGLFKQKEINEPDDNDTVTTLRPGTVKKKTTTEMINKPVASASAHVFATAQRLGLIPILLFDDFLSTLDIEQEGVTYQDIISNVFGWSSRVPHKMINVFIRGNFLYVVQRGHEQNTIDISSADIGDNISINRQLIRTSYGVTHKTTDLEKQSWDEELDIGEEILDEEPDPEEPEEDEPEEDEEPEEPARNLPTYERSEEGNVVTEVWYYYDNEGNLKNTTTITSSGKLGGEFSYENVAAGGFISNKVVVTNYYEKRSNGEKLIKDEITDEYEMKSEIVQGYDGEGEWHDYAKGTYIWVDGKKIHHTYTTVGQQHVSSASQDGTIDGSTTASARRDDRPTPFDDDRNNQLRDADERQQQAEYDDNGDRKWSGSYTYINGKKYKTYGYKRTPKTITGTLDEVLLYDSSFPVDDSKAQSITNDLKWLNRAIQETVTLDVYNFPHVFTLNDKIVFQGKTYYLQSNHVSRTPNITNKQTLELVRWYKNQSNALILPFLVLRTWSRG